MSDETIYEITTEVIDVGVWTTIAVGFGIPRNDLNQSPEEYGFRPISGTHDEVVLAVEEAVEVLDGTQPAQAAGLLWVASNLDLTIMEANDLASALQVRLLLKSISVRAWHELMRAFHNRCAHRIEQAKSAAETTTSS